MLGCRISWEGFYDLLGRPPRGWILSHLEMNDSASLVNQNDKNIQDPKCRSWHRKKINTRDGTGFISKKRLPRWRRCPAPSGAILIDRRLAERDSQFGQLPDDARSAPSRIRSAHGSDQLSNFTIDSRPSRTLHSAFPGPILFEAILVPIKDRSGPRDQQDLLPTIRSS